MSVFCIDFEHAKDVSDLQMAPGIDEKNMFFAPKNVCFPSYFRGKWNNPKFRVQGWSASKVRWSTGRGSLKVLIRTLKYFVHILFDSKFISDINITENSECS